MPSSSVRLLCPNLRCRTVLSVPATARGKTVRCRSCGVRIKVPGGNKPAPTEAAKEESQATAS